MGRATPAKAIKRAATADTDSKSLAEPASVNDAAISPGSGRKKPKALVKTTSFDHAEADDLKSKVRATQIEDPP